MLELVDTFVVNVTDVPGSTADVGQSTLIVGHGGRQFVHSATVMVAVPGTM
jgi:hypothetical protein